jgi:FkbM family methyltransferase
MSELYEHFLQVGDELDVKTRPHFVSGQAATMIGHPLPHEAFEWMALLDAIAEATTDFTMLELGAGFGRWTVRAAAAVRRYRADLTYRLVAVEAEPTHFEWLRLHTSDNNLGLGSSAGTCKLVNAAVSRQLGEDSFYVGNAAGWYGQALLRPENVGADAPTEPVPTVTLSSLIDPLDRVDLIDVDIQGAELEVLTEAAASLGRVRRVYVETHSEAIDEALPAIFERAEGQWSLTAAAPLGARLVTPLNDASFDEGGAQLWINCAAPLPGSPTNESRR